MEVKVLGHKSPCEILGRQQQIREGAIAELDSQLWRPTNCLCSRSLFFNPAFQGHCEDQVGKHVSHTPSKSTGAICTPTGIQWKSEKDHQKLEISLRFFSWKFVVFYENNARSCQIWVFILILKIFPGPTSCNNINFPRRNTMFTHWFKVTQHNMAWHMHPVGE